MSKNRSILKRGFCGLALALSLALPTGGALAVEDATADQIIKALRPPRVTRGLTISPANTARAAEEKRFVDRLRSRPARSLSVEERNQVALVTASKPTIDLEINFEFNSAVIGARAAPQVTALGQALSSTDLNGRTFVLAGHTDAKGSDDYNQGLSERRADAVKRYLMENYGIEAANLVTVGYGKTRLKNAGHPLSGENRRVQIVNLEE